MQILAQIKEFGTTDTGATIVGVTAGNALGELVGESVKVAFDAKGWKGVLYEGAVKWPMALGAFIIGKSVGGVLKWIMYGVSIGAASSSINDIIEEAVPGSPGYAQKVGRNFGVWVKAVVKKERKPIGTYEEPVAPRIETTTPVTEVEMAAH